MELLQPLMAHQSQRFANFGCKRPFLFADGEWNLSATLQGACLGGGRSILSFSVILTWGPRTKEQRDKSWWSPVVRDIARFRILRFWSIEITTLKTKNWHLREHQREELGKRFLENTAGWKDLNGTFVMLSCHVNRINQFESVWNLEDFNGAFVVIHPLAQRGTKTARSLYLSGRMVGWFIGKNVGGPLGWRAPSCLTPEAEGALQKGIFPINFHQINRCKKQRFIIKGPPSQGVSPPFWLWLIVGWWFQNVSKKHQAVSCCFSFEHKRAYVRPVLNLHDACDRFLASHELTRCNTDDMTESAWRLTHSP